VALYSPLGGLQSCPIPQRKPPGPSNIDTATETNLPCARSLDGPQKVARPFHPDRFFVGAGPQAGVNPEARHPSPDRSKSRGAPFSLHPQREVGFRGAPLGLRTITLPSSSGTQPSLRRKSIRSRPPCRQRGTNRAGESQTSSLDSIGRHPQGFHRG
jgi:hypothetical protein